MREFYFVTDLHGRKGRYEKLLQRIQSDPPSALFLGGDILPSPFLHQNEAGRPSLKNGVGLLIDKFSALRRSLGPDYPQVFIILGNDDAKVEESAILTGAQSGI
ncbi:MAG: metallophosphoesterase, partial [Verrucomicrobiota bacterium]